METVFLKLNLSKYLNPITDLEEIQKTEEHVKHHGIAFSKIQAVENSAGQTTQFLQ